MVNTGGGFIYPVMSTDKRAAFGHRLIRVRSRVHQKFGVWCPISLNGIIGPHNLRRHYELGTLLLSASSSVQWTLEWAWNCPWLLPTERCYCTHSSCSHDAIARCDRGQNTFNGHSATTVTQLHSPCGQQWKAQFT